MNELQYFDFHEKEAQAENYAVPFVNGFSFSDCLSIHHIKPDITVFVTDHKGKTTERKIEAPRIYGLWEDYLRATGQVTGETFTRITKKTAKEKTIQVVKKPIILSGNVDLHIDQMYNWLTNDYTDLYKAIETEEDKDWLRTIIRMIVYRRIMENKHKSQLNTGKGFIDPKVYDRVSWIYNLNFANSQLAKTYYSGTYKGVTYALQDSEHIDAELKQREIVQDIANKAAVAAVKAAIPALREELTKSSTQIQQQKKDEIEGGKEDNE